jgi:hypothetical protein
MNQLFDQLCQRYNVRPDRRGECAITCPACGKEPKRGQVHFSFGQDGGFCFVCGFKCGLIHLAKLKGIETREQQQPKIEKSYRAPNWMSSAWDYVRRFEQHPQRFELWASYKPLAHSWIQRRRLGVGVLPSSKCPHERLIVPVISGSSVVGLRGRSMGCDCGKWLQAGGTRLESMPLYPGLPPADSVVWIVENPVDALMVQAMTPYWGVATYSVAYWRDAWTDQLKAVHPRTVIVAFDNDLPGNGCGHRREQAEREWMVNHPKAMKIPESAGPRLANRLLESGLPAVLFDWKGLNTKDVGGLLMSTPTGGGMSSKTHVEATGKAQDQFSEKAWMISGGH